MNTFTLPCNHFETFNLLINVVLKSKPRKLILDSKRKKTNSFREGMGLSKSHPTRVSM